MSDGMGREPAYLSSHATNRYFIPNWGSKGKNLNSPANCVDTWIRTKDPHHVKVIL